MVSRTSKRFRRCCRRTETLAEACRAPARRTVQRRYDAEKPPSSSFAGRRLQPRASFGVQDVHAVGDAGRRPSLAVLRRGSLKCRFAVGLNFPEAGCARMPCRPYRRNTGRMKRGLPRSWAAPGLQLPRPFGTRRAACRRSFYRCGRFVGTPVHSHAMAGMASRKSNGATPQWN